MSDWELTDESVGIFDWMVPAGDIVDSLIEMFPDLSHDREKVLKVVSDVLEDDCDDTTPVPVIELIAGLLKRYTNASELDR